MTHVAHQLDVSINEVLGNLNSATERELEEAARSYGRQPPKYDHHPSGRLTIAMKRWGTIRQANFSDTKTIDLADRLPFILQEIELRAEADERRRLEREREEAERQRAWEKIRDQAVLDYAEQYRARVLDRQATNWRHAAELRDYLDAMEAHIDTLTGDKRATAEAWHAWATAHALQLNPLGRIESGVPTVPEPTGEDLKPFMRGYSPYGPRGW